MEFKEPALAERFADVRSRIAAAAMRSGRRPEEISLVAVTKGVSADRIEAAIQVGHNLFGENYIQEARSKIPLLRANPKVAFHLIGHLQRNKVGAALELFEVIQSVDSIRLVDELVKRVTEQVRVLVQVNVSGEEQKGGCRPEEISHIIERILQAPKVILDGLMTIGSVEAGERIRRAEFARLRALRDRCAESFGIKLTELSMGMSGDFEWAIEEGATVVRVGSALFGDRS